jgi:hypothetical protein
MAPIDSSFFDKLKSLFVDRSLKNYGVMQFLTKVKTKTIHEKRLPNIVLVDNANLLSTKLKADLIEWNIQNNSKLILLNDNKGLLPQQTGAGLAGLDKNHIKVITIQDTSSKYNQTNARESVNQLTQAANHTIEIRDTDHRLEAMAKHFCKLDKSGRERSWLVSHKKDAIQALNAEVHKTLKSKGEISDSFQAQVLLPKFVLAEKMRFAKSFNFNDQIRFNSALKSLGISRGEYLKVVDRNNSSNAITLEKVNGQKVKLQLNKLTQCTFEKIEVFTPKSIELGLGESISLQRSISRMNIVRGERFTISKIHKNTLKIRNAAGKQFTIDLQNPEQAHWNYGYATNLHAIAYDKPHTLIADIRANGFSADQRKLNQMLTQAKTTWLYTDNLSALSCNIEKNTGNKFSAHEIILRSNASLNNLKSLYTVLEQQIETSSKQTNSANLTEPAVDAIDYAIQHLAEREAGFTHKDVIETAIKHALGNVSPAELQAVTLAFEKAGITLRGHRNDGTLWTTLEAVKMEREIIAFCQREKGTLSPLVDQKTLDAYVMPAHLKAEQAQAVKDILLSTDRVTAVQGYAGTGKTTLLCTVEDILGAKPYIEKAGYKILGLAPTNKAVAELIKRDLQAQTLDSFIISCQKKTSAELGRDYANRVLVLDESSMVSSRRALKILQLCKNLNLRLILVGDISQLPAVEGGNPFEQIQKNVHTIYLRDIQRQKNPTLRKAVGKVITGDFGAAFNTLEKNITEIANPKPDKLLKDMTGADWRELQLAGKNTRLDALADCYFSYSTAEQKNLQIITPAHRDRRLVNEKIRQGLMSQGKLAYNTDQNFSILKAESMTQVEMGHITNYVVGHILRLGQTNLPGVKSGDYLEVSQIHKEVNVLELKNAKGEKFAWQVPKFDSSRVSPVEVFSAETRPLQSGDKIRWFRTNKQENLFSTDSAEVLAVNKDSVRVRLADKTEFSFDPKDPKYQHWDHGYAATAYAVQGESVSIVLSYLESGYKNLASQRTFLVALTRAIDHFSLFTDDAKALCTTIINNPGDKLSSLEIIGESVLKSSQEDANQTKRAKLTSREHPVPSVVAQPDHSNKTSVSLDQKVNHLAPDSGNFFSKASIENMKDRLNQNAAAIAILFQGEPIKNAGNHLKFGSKQGSLSVTIKGDKQGWFNDFSTDVGGRDMLHFIQIYGGMSRQEAIEYAASWLGILPDQQHRSSKINPPKLQSIPAKSSTEGVIKFSEYELKRIEYANKLAQTSIPIKNTLAEKYLQNHRGIDTQKLSEDIRFHPGIYAKPNGKSLPALLSIARNSQGNIQSVEAIFLDNTTANKADVSLPKQTIGPKKLAAVFIQRVKNSKAPTLIAEGVVTALSIANALPKANVIAVMGKQLYLSVDDKFLTKEVVFCLDNDGKKLSSDKLILAAANRLTALKKNVSIMLPKSIHQAKLDYNDVL